MNPNADHDPYSPSLYDLMHAYPRKRKSRGGGIWVCLSFGLGGAIMAGVLAAFVFFVLADGKLTIDNQAGTETAQAQTAEAQTLAAIPTITPTLTRAPSLTPAPTITATNATLLPADTPTITPTSFSALVPLATSAPITNSVIAIRWLNDDSGIVVASALGVWLYTLSDPAQPIAIIAPSWVGQNSIVSMAMSPTENSIAVAYDTGRIELYNIATLQSIRDWETYQDIYKMDFSPDGDLLAMGTELGDVQIWNVATGQLATTLEGNVSALSVAYNKAGDRLVAGRVDKKVELWDPINNNRLATGETTYSGWVADVAFSPLTDSLGVVSEDEGVTIYSSLASRGTLQVLHFIASHSTAMAFSTRDENLIATAEVDGFLKVWALDTGSTRHSFPYEASVNAVAFAHADVLVAGGDADGIIRIWNVVSGAKYVELKLP